MTEPLDYDRGLPVARVAYINKISPRPSKQGMPEMEFHQIFGRWRFHERSTMEGMEQYEQVIHCANCLRVDDQGSIHAYRMMVIAEKDLLGNFPSVLKLICYGCGKEEMVPCREPFKEHYERPSYAELYSEYRKNRDAMAGMQQQAYAQHQSQAMQAQLQKMQAMQNQISSMSGMLPALLGGFGGAGGGSAIQGPPVQMTATEVRMRQEQAKRSVHDYKLMERVERVLKDLF